MNLIVRHLLFTSLLSVALIFGFSQHALADDPPLTNQDVIKMVAAKLPSNTIVMTINASPSNFDTGPQALIGLSKSGVPQSVIEAMISKKSGGSSASASEDTNRNAVGVDANGLSPEEITVIDGDKRQKMRYTISRTRTAARAFGMGGMAAYAALVGLRASLRIESKTPTFEVAVPENAQPESYLTLAHLAVRRNKTREVMIGGGYMSSSSGIATDRIVETRGTRKTNQSGTPKGFVLYSVTPVNPLPPGEYALVTYNSAIKVAGWFASGADSYFDFGID